MGADEILILSNPIQRYPWGSRTAIADLLGVPASGEPQAELWMGAHPRAPSRVRTPEGEMPLDAWIARDPESALGLRVAARFGSALPFLFKVLAAERPLSIQVHPGPAQARAGYEREERAGIARDAAERSYPDPNPKAELICALTRFHALNRFRDPDEIAAGFAMIGAPELTSRLASDRGGPDLTRFFAALMELDVAERQGLLGQAMLWARRCAEDASTRDETAETAYWILSLARDFPGDVGILSPLLFNLVTLEPGEAMYLPSGELHSYLGGVGIELMNSSDNVLRGGLTTKHVDVPEVLAALSGRAGSVMRLRPEPAAAGLSVYRTPAPEFALSVIDARDSGAFASPAEHGVEILLCTEGACTLTIPGQGELRLTRGASVFVPASAPPYRLAGPVVVHRASVPDP